MGLGGVLLPPRDSGERSPETPEPNPTTPEPDNLASVVGLELSEDGRQLVLRTDQPIRYSSILLEIASILERQGVNVVMTRRDNRTLDLEPRVQIAERANADYFVSIHANAISLSRPNVNGVEVYYYSDGGRRLANAIHGSFLNAIEMNDRGVRQARFYVIRNTSMPAALVEVGFVTGAQDTPRLAGPQFRSRIAEAIARGILQHAQGR